MDNYFQNCPAVMNDSGRLFGDFKTATRRNEYIKYINDIYRDDQYRYFLQNNAQLIMDREWEWNKKNTQCWTNDCIHHYPLRNNPRHFVQEREAYDSIFNLRTNAQLSPMRQCKLNRKDYRLNL